MVERDVSREDIVMVLLSADDCRVTPRTRWRLSGADSREERLTLIVELRAEALVVTLFRGDE